VDKVIITAATERLSWSKWFQLLSLMTLWKVA